MMRRGACIAGVGSCTPDRVVTNFDLEKTLDTTDEWITERTGIKERRVAAPDENNSDLAFEAAKRALSVAGLQPKDLDLIIEATVTSDMLFPATASLVQDRLRAAKAGAFDLSAGCSGFMYGVAIAADMIRAGSYGNVLVIGCEVLSKIMDWEDRNTAVLFGDGAGAVVVSACEDDAILAYQLGSQGSGADSLKMIAGGTRMRPSHETIEKKLHAITMEGREVFRFAVVRQIKASQDVLRMAGLSADDVDLFIPHQANMRIIDAAAERLGFPKEKVFVNLHKYGNTSAGSIPVAMDEAYREGRLKKGDKVLSVGFGAGLSWAAMVFEWVLEPPSPSAS
jgi:3-oxoacyl-[acyl-carrier-protein] synthase-3